MATGEFNNEFNAEFFISSGVTTATHPLLLSWPLIVTAGGAALTGVLLDNPTVQRRQLWSFWRYGPEP